jgi:hypothetical protein
MNHLDATNKDKQYRTVRIFGKTGYTDLLVPHESFRERNIQLRKDEVNFSVLDTHQHHR